MVSQLQRRQHQSQAKVFLGAEWVKSSNGQDTVPVNFNHLEARLKSLVAILIPTTESCNYFAQHNRAIVAALSGFENVAAKDD